MSSNSLSGAQAVFQTEGGIIVEMGPPDLTIEFTDPKVPAMRNKQIAEVAEQAFQLNGIKKYWAGCDGNRCVVAGWGG